MIQISQQVIHTVRIHYCLMSVFAFNSTSMIYLQKFFELIYYHLAKKGLIFNVIQYKLKSF